MVAYLNGFRDKTFVYCLSGTSCIFSYNYWSLLASRGTIVCKHAIHFCSEFVCVTHSLLQSNIFSFLSKAPCLFTVIIYALGLLVGWCPGLLVGPICRKQAWLVSIFSDFLMWDHNVSFLLGFTRFHFWATYFAVWNIFVFRVS